MSAQPEKQPFHLVGHMKLREAVLRKSIEAGPLNQNKQIV